VYLFVYEIILEYIFYDCFCELLFKYLRVCFTLQFGRSSIHVFLNKIMENAKKILSFGPFGTTYKFKG
jgi:hypothetical protein